MLIAMRNALMAGGGLSAKSYVQDGLIAMWDGIENAGWGQHDPNARVWKDLVSGAVINFTTLETGGSVTWHDNLADFYNAVGLSSGLSQAFESNFTCDLCLMRDGSFFQSALSAVGGIALEAYRSGKDMGFGVKNVYSAIWASNKSANTITIAVDGSDELHYGDGQYVRTRNKATRYGQFPLGVAYSPPRSASEGSRGNAKIYCVRLYNRALTADEIAANHAVDKARFNLPDAT